MNCLSLVARRYFITAFPQLNAFKTIDNLNFQQIYHKSKIPEKPSSTLSLLNISLDTFADVSIDANTIHLLERLSLVRLDDKEALSTLRSSIQFALKITAINTTNIKPLYTVLEEQALCLRNDKITEGNCREEILRNAKLIDEDYFISPPGNIPLQQD